MIRLNGQERSDCEGITLDKLLEREGFERARIAVEINGEIVSKSEYEGTEIHSGDVIEVVSFVGGG